jgi:hypothetical protein
MVESAADDAAVTDDFVSDEDLPAMDFLARFVFSVGLVPGVFLDAFSRLSSESEKTSLCSRFVNVRKDDCYRLK